MQIAQMKPPLGFRPGIEAGFRLLHDVSFPLQARGRDGQRAEANTGLSPQAYRAPRTPRGPDAPLPAVYASAYHRVRLLFHAEQASPARARWRAAGPPLQQRPLALRPDQRRASTSPAAFRSPLSSSAPGSWGSC